MVDFANLATLVTDLIFDFSEEKTLTLVRTVEGNYDPQTRITPQVREDTFTIKAVKTNFRNPNLPGTEIKDEDSLLLVAPIKDSNDNDIIPTSDDTVKDGSKEFKIITCETVQPGTTILLHKVFIRE